MGIIICEHAEEIINEMGEGAIDWRIEEVNGEEVEFGLCPLCLTALTDNMEWQNDFSFAFHQKDFDKNYRNIGNYIAEAN